MYGVIHQSEEGWYMCEVGIVETCFTDRKMDQKYSALIEAKPRPKSCSQVKTRGSEALN